jgi:hypothetical protein
MVNNAAASLATPPSNSNQCPAAAASLRQFEFGAWKRQQARCKPASQSPFNMSAKRKRLATLELCRNGRLKGLQHVSEQTPR